MGVEAPQFAVFPGGMPGRSETPPGCDFQELWFRLVRMQWASLVLVPADAGGSADAIATSLAEVGTGLRDMPVTAIVAGTMDYRSARALAELQPRIHDGRPWPGAVEIEPRPSAPPGPPPVQPAPPVRDAQLMPPLGRAIIAIRPVVDQPLGIAVAQAADAVVVCIHLGTTRLKSARRTIELIGQERIIGSILVR